MPHLNVMTTSYRTLSAALVLLAFAGGMAVPVSGQERTLTPSEVDDAIRWGDTGDPSAYVLHHAQNEGTTSDVVVGLVYTPFVRVALAAKAAHDRGERLDREDLPQTLVEP